MVRWLRSLTPAALSVVVAAIPALAAAGAELYRTTIHEPRTCTSSGDWEMCVLNQYESLWVITPSGAYAFQDHGLLQITVADAATGCRTTQVDAYTDKYLFTETRGVQVETYRDRHEVRLTPACAPAVCLLGVSTCEIRCAAGTCTRDRCSYALQACE